MFDYISGKLVSRSSKCLVVDVNGIGFNIFVPLSTYSSLSQDQDFVKLFIYFYMREDAILLYGFKTEEEKKIFEMLLSVSGVGPKLAISILSELSASELKSAIIRQDAGLLNSISGVGKKITQRILLELKEKAVFIAGKDDQSFSGGQSMEDAIQALVSLGYSQPSSFRAVKKVLDTEEKDMTLEVLIKKSLKELK